METMAEKIRTESFEEPEADSVSTPVARLLLKTVQTLIADPMRNPLVAEAFRQGKKSSEAKVTRVHNVLRRIIEDLPIKRDWLDPLLEAEARNLLGEMDPSISGSEASTVNAASGAGNSVSSEDMPHPRESTPRFRFIGDVRKCLFIGGANAWNSVVRDVTAKLEQPDCQVDEEEVLKKMSEYLRTMCLPNAFRYRR